MTGQEAAAQQASPRGRDSVAQSVLDHDWSQTSLGARENWSPTVTAIVNLVLNAKVPMALLWGREGILMVNQACARIGGTLPVGVLGGSILEVWPETLAFHRQVLGSVLKGETLTYRNQALQLERDGRRETASFDLDYSPITEPDGRVIGALVILNETTTLVRAQNWLAGERDRLQQMFEQAPGFMAMLSGPDHVFELTNAAYMQLSGHRDVLGLPVRVGLPELAGQGFYELLDRSYATGEPFVGQGVRVLLQRRPQAEPEERFVDMVYQPVRDPDGAVIGIFVEGSDVTDRVRAEAKMRRDVEQLQSFAEAMPNHVWTAPPDGRPDWFNSRAHGYVGLAAGELDDAAWTAAIHADDVAGVAAHWCSCVATGKPYVGEFRIRRGDGAYLWHLVRAVPIRDGAGRITRWIGTNTDIDDHKKLTERLAESEARLRLAIEAGQMAVWDFDLRTNQLTPSPALNRLFGFPETATPSLSEYESRFAPGKAARILRAATKAARRNGGDFEQELHHVMPDRSDRWLLVRAQVVDEGRRLIGVVIDMTERRLAEEELMASERRFRLSQRAAGIASLEMDIASGLVMGSERFWEIWGLDQRESIHAGDLQALLLPADRPIGSTEATRRDGTAELSVQYRIQRPDTGEIRWLSRDVEFLHDRTGRPVKMFGVMRDITGQKEAEERQALLTHELEHRIKNILAMVSAIAAQTLRNSDLETAAAKFSERLGALSNAHDLLTQTRWTAADLEDVVRSAIRVLPVERVIVKGPPVTLGPKMALSMALAINELATNALKYGALSNDAGRVSIVWQLQHQPGRPPELVWRWAEQGGPEVIAPTRRGFGRFLIERVLAADFKGNVKVQFLASGVDVVLSAPLPDTPSTN